MKLRQVYLFLLPCLFLFLSCSNSETLLKQAAVLDSLDGALGLISREIAGADSAQIKKAQNLYSTYRFFLRTRSQDTLSPEEADRVARFFSSGENLDAYVRNRVALSRRCQLIRNQLANLKSDVNHGAIKEMDFGKNLEREKIAANQLTELFLGEQKKYCSALEEFKSTLPDVEAWVRKKNSGQLPSIEQPKTESEWP